MTLLFIIVCPKPGRGLRKQGLCSETYDLRWQHVTWPADHYYYYHYLLLRFLKSYQQECYFEDNVNFQVALMFVEIQIHGSILNETSHDIRRSGSPLEFP